MIISLGDSQKELDQALLTKMKSLMVSLALLGPLAGIIPAIYILVRHNQNARDWINFSLYCLELFHIYSVAVLLGRSRYLREVRSKLGYPDMLISTSSSHEISAHSLEQNPIGSSSSGVSVGIDMESTSSFTGNSVVSKNVI
eukprot:gene8372-10286_t